MKKHHGKSTKCTNDQSEYSEGRQEASNIQNASQSNNYKSKHNTVIKPKVGPAGKRKSTNISTLASLTKEEKKPNAKICVSRSLRDKRHGSLAEIGSNKLIDFLEEAHGQPLEGNRNIPEIFVNQHHSINVSRQNDQIEKRTIMSFNQSISQPIFIPGNNNKLPQLVLAKDMHKLNFSSPKKVFLPPISDRFDTAVDDHPDTNLDLNYNFGTNVTISNDLSVLVNLKSQDDIKLKLELLEVVDDIQHSLICLPTLKERANEIIEYQGIGQVYYMMQFPVLPTELNTNFEESTSFTCNLFIKQNAMVYNIPSLTINSNAKKVTTVKALHTEHFDLTLSEKLQEELSINTFDTQPMESINTRKIEGDQEQTDVLITNMKKPASSGSFLFRSKFSNGFDSTFNKMVGNGTGESRDSFISNFVYSQINFANIFSKLTRYQKTTAYSNQADLYCTVRPRIRYTRTNKASSEKAANKYLRMVGIHKYCPNYEVDLVYPAVMGKDKILYKLEGPAAEHKINSGPKYNGNKRYAYPFIPRRSTVLKNYYMLETAELKGPVPFSQGVMCHRERVHQEDASMISDSSVMNKISLPKKIGLRTESGDSVDQYLARTELGRDDVCPMLTIPSNEIQKALEQVNKNKTLAGFMVYSTKDNGMTPTEYNPKGGKNCKLVPLYLETGQHDVLNYKSGRTLSDLSKQSLQSFPSDENNNEVS